MSYDTKEYVEFASKYILENGYVSKSRIEKEGLNQPPTTDLVNEAFETTPEFEPTDESTELVDYIYSEYLANLDTKRNDPNKGLNNFEGEVYRLLRSENLNLKMAGFLTAAINSAKSQMNRDDSYSDMSKSTYVGTVGEKIGGQVTVLNCSNYNSRFGVSTRVLMQSPRGNIFVWFATGHKKFDVGEKYNVTGWLKAHNEYKGVKQNIMNRCVLDRIEPVSEIM